MLASGCLDALGRKRRGASHWQRGREAAAAGHRRGALAAERKVQLEGEDPTEQCAQAIEVGVGNGHVQQAQERALKDLLDNRKQDLQASQQEAQRELKKLEQALAGQKTADELKQRLIEALRQKGHKL